MPGRTAAPRPIPQADGWQVRSISTSHAYMWVRLPNEGGKGIASASVVAFKPA